ncbi:MAG: hypothetical protein AAGA99_08105 [Actinomycetota bacterium]
MEIEPPDPPSARLGILAEPCRNDQNLVALRKAAVLAHWIPELDLQIHQVGSAGVRVAASRPPAGFRGASVDPCEFRRLVIRVMAGEVGVAARELGLVLGHQLRIELHAGPGLLIGAHGLVRAELDGEWGVLATAVLGHDGGAALASVTVDDVAPPDDTVQLDLDHDGQVDVTLLHASFPLRDRVRERIVLSALSAAAATYAAEEVALALAGLDAPS